MYAIVATWRLLAPIQTGTARSEFLRELLTSGIDLARRAGAVDVVMIELDPDRLMTFTLLETADEATAASARLQQFVADRYVDRLEIVDRIVGRAYDPSQLNAAASPGSRVWADDCEAMHASIVTWRLDASIRSPDALESFLHDIWERFAETLHRLGLLDVVVVRSAEDSILAIRLYADNIELDASYRQAVATVGAMLEGKVEFVEKREGRAFDVPQLLGRSE